METSDPVVVAEGLGRRFGRTVALDGFDLTARAGTVHGLLGPNGAGKTTAVRILATLLVPDAGRAEVAGFDVVRGAEHARYRIGLVGQQPAVDDRLSGRQNLAMFGQLYHLGARAAARRADELLERFGLAATGRKAVKDYSGGMRRRLDLAAALIRTPLVLFLDEPTTGLDPHSRNEVWTAVRSMVADGTTVLLTTQYLEEADQLADRISVIGSGRVIAEGSPEELKSTIGGDRVDVVVRDAADLPAAAHLVHGVTGTDAESDQDARRVSAPVPEHVERVAALTAVARALQDDGVSAEDVALRRPTLDEVLLDLTATTRPLLEAKQ